MRIATWNVNGLRARLDFVFHWLEARDPDVVGLQELKLEDEKFPHLEFQARGYHAVTHGQKSWNGVAVLAKEKPEVVARGLPGQEAMGARLITASVAGLEFTSVYVPNGKTVTHEDFPKKLAWLDSLVKHFDSASPNTVLCGDFNLVPDDVDTWDPEGHAGHIFHTEDERGRWAALRDHGLTDLFRERYPNAREFSWWDYRAGAFHKKQGLRIDFLLGTSAIADRVVEATIDRDYRKKKDGLIASDHAPVYVDLS